MVHAPVAPVWMTPFAYAVAYCETRANYRHHARDPNGDLEGAWGWRHNTWLMDRYPYMPLYAYRATPRQQYRVFLRSLARRRTFGCIVHGGYRAWL